MSSSSSSGSGPRRRRRRAAAATSRRRRGRAAAAATAAANLGGAMHAVQRDLRHPLLTKLNSGSSRLPCTPQRGRSPARMLGASHSGMPSAMSPNGVALRPEIL